MDIKYNYILELKKGSMKLKRFYFSFFMLFVAILYVEECIGLETIKDGFEENIITVENNTLNDANNKVNLESHEGMSFPKILNKVFTFFNNQATWSFLLVTVTAIYVIITARILKANKKVIQIMRDEFEASLRPYIVVSTYMIPGNAMICLKIANHGKTIAKDLRLKIDRNFYQYGSKEERYNLAKAYIFNNNIETFSPGTELLFYLGMGFTIFSDNIDPLLTPKNFTITAEYNFEGRNFYEKNTIDLESYRKTSLPPQDAVVTQLKELVREIKKLK